MAPIMIKMLGPIVHNELMIKSDSEEGSLDEKRFSASKPSGLKIKRFSQPVEGLTKPYHISAAEKAGIMLGRKNNIRMVFFASSCWLLNNAATKMDVNVCKGMMTNASLIVCHSAVSARSSRRRIL